MSSRCGPRPVTPRSRSRSSRASSAADGRRLAAVVERARPAGRARRRAPRRRATSSAIASRRDSTSARAERRDLLRPRRDRLAGRGADRDAPQRRVPLPDRGRVLERQRRPARQQPAERAVEVRAARRGAALDDGEAVGREDERRDLGAELLGRAQRRAVQLRAASRPAAAASPRARRGRPPRSPASATRAPSAPSRTSCWSARVRGEKPCVPTCSDSSRFVLPAPFAPVTSTRPGSSASSSRS